MSLLLRPVASNRLSTLTFLAAIAVARGLESATNLKARLRWPNDVMINDRKVAGVIAESNYLGQKFAFATIGIGVNCNSGVPESVGPATNIAGELGHSVDTAALARSILEAFGGFYDKRLDGADVVEVARSIMGTLGRRVTIRTTSGETIEGLAQIIGSDGSITLVQGDRKTTFHAENVERLQEA